MMKTILITNQPDIAKEAEAAGVSRIMVDLETIGKKERQASRNTFISAHTKDDIAKIRAVLKKAELIVRINPWYESSKDEIEHAIANGADLIMLPMITNLAQLDACIKAMAGRARVLPLVETSYSMDHVGEIAANKHIDEIYIGLNDLHLSLGNDFLFEPLADGLVDVMAEKIKAHGKPFGFGGMAMMGSGELPAQRVLGEHERMGSGCVILSSRFCKDVRLEETTGRLDRMKAAVEAMHAEYKKLGQRSAAQREDDRKTTNSVIEALAARVRQARKAQ